jgi:hypothetical protein
MPLAAVQAQLPQIMTATISRVHAMKSPRLARLFVHSSAVFCGVHGPAMFESLLESVHPGTFFSVADGVLAPMGNKVLGEVHRREAAIGLTRLICETQTFFSDAPRQALWGKLLCAVVELLASAHAPHEGAKGAAGGAAAAASASSSLLAFVEEEDDDPLLEGEALPAEYTAAYSRLVHAGNAPPYAFPSHPDARAFFVASLGALAGKCPPGAIAGLIRTTPVAAAVEAMCTGAGVRL